MENRVYLYKLLSVLLSYPDAKGWEMMEKMFQHFDLQIQGELLEALHDFKGYRANSKHTLEELQSQYLSFFDMGGVVSPYESEYAREKISRKPRIIADAAGFYKAFGFEIQELAENREVLDDISVELEFMAILYLKKMFAREEEQSENIEVVDSAIQRFLKDHLAGWGLFYCNLIQESDGPLFYQQAGKLLASLLQDEVKTYNLNLEEMQRGLVRPAPKRTEKEGFNCGQMM